MEKLSEIATSFDDDDILMKTAQEVFDKVFSSRTHAFVGYDPDIFWAKGAGAREFIPDNFFSLWYRSTSILQGPYHPTVNWISKRKWPLNEQLNLHILNLQEVTL